MLIPKVYPVLSDAIEQGVEHGLDLALEDGPITNRESLAEMIKKGVMYQFMERFDIKETDQVH